MKIMLSVKSVIFLITIVQVDLVENVFGYAVPEPKVEILIPTGIRVSIPHDDGLSSFIFHGAINRSLDEINQPGDFSGEITQPINGRWLYENMQVALSSGDVLNFWARIRHNDQDYRLLGRSITIPELQPIRVDSTSVETTRPEYVCKKITTATTPSPIRNEHLKVTICLTTIRS